MFESLKKQVQPAVQPAELFRNLCKKVGGDADAVTLQEDGGAGSSTQPVKKQQSTVCPTSSVIEESCQQKNQVDLEARRIPNVNSMDAIAKSNQVGNLKSEKRVLRKLYEFVGTSIPKQLDPRVDKLVEDDKDRVSKLAEQVNPVYSIEPQNKESVAINQVTSPGQMPIVIRVEQPEKATKSSKARTVVQDSDGNNSRPNAGVSADKLASRLDYRVMDNVVYVRMENLGGAFTILGQHQLMVLLNMWFHNDAVACGTVKHLKEILDFLLIDPNHNVTIEESAGLRNRINFIDGYFDVNIGKYMPYDGRFYINYLKARTADVERAGEPVNFDRFVWMLAGGNPLIYTKIWQMIAIIITNDFRLKKIFLCQGVGNAGKSTLLATIRLLYPDAQQADFVLTDFADPFTQTELFGKALNIGDENGKLVDAVAVEVLKKWSAGEHSKISVRVKHQGARRVIPRTHLVFATNNAMTFEDATDAFFERLEVIPFGFRVNLEEFGVEDVVTDLFVREIPAIIKNAIGYYQQLRVNKFVFAGNFCLNAVVDRGTKRNFEDKFKTALTKFLGDSLEPSQDSVLFLADLRLAFNEWCCNMGADGLQVTNQAKFRSQVEEILPNSIFANKYNRRCGGSRSAIIGYVLKS